MLPDVLVGNLLSDFFINIPLLFLTDMDLVLVQTGLVSTTDPTPKVLLSNLRVYKTHNFPLSSTPQSFFKQIKISYRQCGMGYFESSINDFDCTICPEGTYTATEGLKKCTGNSRYFRLVKQLHFV